MCIYIMWWAVNFSKCEGLKVWETGSFCVETWWSSGIWAVYFDKLVPTFQRNLLPRLLYHDKKDTNTCLRKFAFGLPEQRASLPRTPPRFHKNVFIRIWFDANIRSSWGSKLTRISVYWSSYVCEIPDWDRRTAESRLSLIWFGLNLRCEKFQNLAWEMGQSWW
jgi:hypothetical protein